MHTDMEREAIINSINKVSGGRSSRQCLSATLAPCFLFGLIFLLQNKTSLSAICCIPFILSIIISLFYLFGLKSKKESLNKRLFNQLLFCIIFSFGSLYLSILFFFTTNENNKFTISLILVLIYIIFVVAFLCIEVFKLFRGKYKNRQSKVITPYIYVVAAILGLSLSRAFQNAKNINIILPYIIAFVLLIISIANIPMFPNIIRIYLVKKYNIDLSEVEYYDSPRNESVAFSNKKRLINTIFVGSIYYASIIFETIELNSVANFFEKKLFILSSICFLFVLNLFLNLFNAFYKMDNSKNSFLSVFLGYILSIVYYIVTMLLLKQTHFTTAFEPVMLELVFFYSMISNVILSIILSLIINHYKKARK